MIYKKKNNKNFLYKKYFIYLNNFLKKFNQDFLYKIPDLFIKDIRKEKIITKNQEFNFFSNLFKKEVFYDDNRISNLSEVLFISHYVGSKEKNQNYDFYFGNLIKQISKKKNTTLLLINHTSENLLNIKTKFRLSDINRIYIDINFHYLKDTLIILKIIKEYFYFKFNKFFFKSNNKNFINIYKKLNFFSFIKSFYTIKLSNRIIDIINNNKKLKNVIVTYEGHAFEKIIFKHCNDKNIKSFGYYFSVIREYQNSIFYQFDRKYMPDIILTGGTKINDYLKKNSYSHDNIKILGSNKNINKIKIAKKNIKNVLVCPEGLFSETVEIFNLINQTFFNKEDIKFIFRTHPVLGNCKKLFNKKNKNIIFSQNKNIKEDFQRCGIILYSGSSVCIQAVNNNLIPINFKKNRDSFSYDPLFEINTYIVSNSNELMHTLKSFSNSSNKKLIYKNYKKIRNYCKTYFEPMNTKVLDNEL